MCDSIRVRNGVLTDNIDGINWNLQQADGVRVDAWQRAIVMNANTGRYIGYDGDIGGDDEAKARGDQVLSYRGYTLRPGEDRDAGIL